MARIFLSYSRVDGRFVEALAHKLRRIYGHDNVWFDEGLHGGDIWWEKILEEIKTRDIFVYILSNESVQSDYCQAEFTEARRLQKQIITIQARDRTRLTDELEDIHYINMANGVDDADALTDLYRSINMRMTKVSKRARKPLWQPATPRPGKFDEKPRPRYAPEVDTPTLNLPPAERENVNQITKQVWSKPRVAFGMLIVLAILGVAAFVRINLPEQAAIATDIIELTLPGISTDVLASDTETTSIAQITPAPATNTATDRPTVTHTNTAILEQTPDFALLARSTLDSEATMIATLWTSTPTDDIPATMADIVAKTRDAAATAAATTWTLTPTVTATHTSTLTQTVPPPSATSTYAPTFTNTPSQTPSSSSTPSATNTATLSQTPTSSATHTPSVNATNTFKPTVENPSVRLRIIQNSVNLRVGPGTDYRIAQTATRDDVFNIQARYLRQGWIWYLVTLRTVANVDTPEDVAWIRSDLIEILDDSELTNLPTASSISATPRPATLVPTQSIATMAVQEVTQAPFQQLQPTQPPPAPTVNRGTPEG